MSLLPNNSSVKTVEVSATLTRTIESIDADGEKQTSAREVSANVKTTVPYSANPESEAGVTSYVNINTAHVLFCLKANALIHRPQL